MDEEDDGCASSGAWNLLVAAGRSWARPAVTGAVAVDRRMEPFSHNT